MSASALLQSIVGLPVSRVWRGHGSAIFLEFGELSTRTSRRTSQESLEGQASLMIEWSWRIERPKSILCGSWSHERRWSKALAQLVGAHVSSVECFGHLPEICVSLTNGLRVFSLMTAEGQPMWALMFRAPVSKSVCVSRGRVIVEQRNAT